MSLDYTPRKVMGTERNVMSRRVNHVTLEAVDILFYMDRGDEVCICGDLPVCEQSRQFLGLRCRMYQGKSPDEMWG